MKLMKLGITLVTFAVASLQVTQGYATESALLSEPQTVKLNQLVDEAPNDHGIVGHTVMVLANGKLVYSRSKGNTSVESDEQVNIDTIYPIYSVTKLYVSAILLRLIEQGRLDAAQPVSAYLDDLPDHWKDIRISSLMAHSSGLPEFFDLSQKTSEDPQAIINAISDKPFAFQTNTNIRYNQTNFLLLKLIIEKQYKLPLTEVINREIVKPYSLNNTVFGGGNVSIPGRTTHYYIRDNGDISDFGVWPFATTMFAATGLNTSGTDIAKWFEVLMSGDFVATDTLLAAWQPLTLKTGRQATYSHGWQVQSESQTTAVGHYGGNIINARHFYMNDNPAENVTILHLTNGGFHPSFSSFDYAYSLAKIINPNITMDTVEFKGRLMHHVENDQLDDLPETYFAFKQNPSTQHIFTEYLINDLAYQLLDTAPTASLKLFELNTQSYPMSANVYDSYAEALFSEGRYIESKVNYQKALELDSSYSHIPERLREISSKLTYTP